jgi:23S rRNA pseudouridine2605 synthase
MQERLQKLLAQAGYDSRCGFEEFITAGRVRVNGKVAILGQKADLAVDKVAMDDHISETSKTVFISPHKPASPLN